MSRPVRTPQQIRNTLLALARELFPEAARLTLLITTGDVEAIRPGPTPTPLLPPDLSLLDRRIVAALSPIPVSSRRLANLIGHRSDSHFRRRLARLVERGLVRYARRGYSRPPAS